MNVEKRRILDMRGNLACLLLLDAWRRA